MSLKRFFGWPDAVAAFAAAALIGAGWWSANRRVDAQFDRVAFLKNEVAKLDKDIAEVRDLREVIAGILARKQVIEMVQKGRGGAVGLLSDLATHRPPGVQLTAVREEGGRVFITGVASAQEHVTAFARRLEGASHLQWVELVELRGERFTLVAASRGRKPVPGGAAPRMPPDIHPGDPK